MFRAHRVIVSSWSRWLRSLLTESPEEEVIALDIFDPDSFGAILDYMYGKPLAFSLEKAEILLKAIRRLEMAKLEEHCWRHLMTVVDKSNCQMLHELADRYDCPALKLTAWRIVQESAPGYSTMPSKLLNQVVSSLVSPRSGMIGT